MNLVIVNHVKPVPGILWQGQPLNNVMSISITTDLLPVRAIHRSCRVRTNNNFMALPKCILHLKATFNMILQHSLERQRLCNSQRQRERVGHPSTHFSFYFLFSFKDKLSQWSPSRLYTLLPLPADFWDYGCDAILGVPWYHSRLIFLSLSSMALICILPRTPPASPRSSLMLRTQGHSLVVFIP